MSSSYIDCPFPADPDETVDVDGEKQMSCKFSFHFSPSFFDNSSPFPSSLMELEIHCPPAFNNGNCFWPQVAKLLGHSIPRP